MKDSQSSLTGHPPEKLIAAYAVGKCSPIEQASIDEHCFTCERCRTRLSILLRLCELDGNDEERRELERLFPLGMEAITQIRNPESIIANQSMTKGRRPISPKESPKEFSGISFLRDLFRAKSFRFAAISVLFFAIAGAAYYWYENAHSPLRKSLLAMQRSYPNSRPIEARMTGEFAYKPYERTRGDLDNSAINKDQLNYALLELTRVVATNPKPQERHALGRLYLLLGKFDEAERQMKLVLESVDNDARVLTDIAALYYERSKYANSNSEQLLLKAVEYYRQAIAIDPNLAEAWFNRALCYENLSVYSSAKEDWKQYLKLDPDSEWAKEAKERLKKLEMKAEQQLPASKVTNDLDKAVASKDDEQLKQLIGKSFVEVNQFSTGKLLDDYLNAEINGNREAADATLINLKRIGALLAEIKGDMFVTDLSVLAARASPEMKRGMLDVRLKLRQADSEFDRSSHDTAYKLYNHAYLKAKRIGDNLHAEIAATKLVRYSNLRAQTEPLIALGNRFILQTEQRKHLHLQSLIYASLANAYLASQQGSKALESGLHSSEIAKKLNDYNTAINGLILAGTAYTRSGNYERAFNKSFEVLSLMRDYPVGWRRSFQAYQQTWESLFRTGNFHLALAYQQEAIGIANKMNTQTNIIGSLGRLGLNLWKIKKNNEASYYLQDAITKCNSITDQTSRQLLQADLYTVVGDIELERGDYEKSLQNYQDAIKSVAASNNSVYLSAIHQGKAAAYLAQNKIAEAEAELQKSILFLESDRKQIANAAGRSIFLARNQSAYNAMIDIQHNYKNNSISAFNYSEAIKSSDLLDSLTNRASTKEIDGSTEVALSGNARPLKLQQIQKSLPNHIQILSYSVTENRLIIWHITKEHFSSVSVAASASEIKNLVTDYLSNVRSKADINQTNMVASKLFHYLISPVSEHLNKEQLLCIVPAPEFNRLPFSALLSIENNRYLVEDFLIVTSPSASILLQTIALAKQKPSLPTKSFIGISNPRFSNNRFPGLPTLPSSEEEVTRASRLYKHGQFLSQANATESQVVHSLGSNNVVHIASHTLINEQIPLMSAILLSEEKALVNMDKGKKSIAYDGKLQASEIYQLSFPQTRLVVLSSCRSAFESSNRSQAIGALAHAFFAARVPSVIASLWDIDDARSAELMFAFHQYHKNQSLGFSESLRLAQCSFLYGSDLDRRHPYYWAAFQLFGCDSGDLSINY
ncbi:MAG: CHAT domain-containing protein [Acidobacteriota bacterium]|nr:CHAT domain-containing protein [Acidobacteriota bacterium]